MRALLLRLLAVVVLLLPVGALAQGNPPEDSAVTFDLSGSNRSFSVGSTAHANFVTFANVPPALRGKTSFGVQITGNGTPWTWAWPSTVRWAEGAAPYVSFVPGDLTKLAFDTSDGGRTWQGHVIRRGEGRMPAAIESFKYFINPSTGSDGNSCRSFEAACASFYGLNAKYTLGPGDRICLASGTRLLNHAAGKPVIAPTTSGSRDAPIVLQGCGPGAPPIVSNASLLQTARWSAAGPTGSATWSTTTTLTGPFTGGPNTCFSWVDTVAGTTRGMCKGTRGTSAAVTIPSPRRASSGGPTTASCRATA